jgi:hypothetical protein
MIIYGRYVMRVSFMTGTGVILMPTHPYRIDSVTSTSKQPGDVLVSKGLDSDLRLVRDSTGVTRYKGYSF